MIYVLTLMSALTSVIGNITAQYWADFKGSIWMMATIVAFTISTICYAYSLRIGGQFTIVNALFYSVVPIITVLFGVFLFHNRLTTLQLVGLFFGFISLILFTLEGVVELPK